MKTRLSLLTFSWLTALLSSCTAPQPSRSLATHPSVDLKKYAGHWHEVARLPMGFEKDCVAATADYSLRPDGLVKVVNTCTRADGTQRQVSGRARVVDARSNAVLEVIFEEWFSIFIPRAKQGNYFILAVTSDYQHALVGTPSRKFLWLLSRTPQMPPAQKATFIEKARALGYPVDRLILNQVHP